jgi:outer membrane protein assembly factor BamA
MVMLDQNRVDIVFEITEGPKSKVRKINIIGNEAFRTAICAARWSPSKRGMFQAPQLGHKL